MLLIFVKISTILTIIFSLGLGFYTIYRNHKNIINWLWFLTCLAVSIWTIGYLMTILTNNAESGRKYLIVVYVGAILIPILYYHFVLKFLMLENKIIVALGYLATLVFLFLNIFTDFIIKGTEYLDGFGYYEKINRPGFYVFIAYFIFYAIYTFYLLIRSYKITDGFKKGQIFFLILATIIGYGGGMTNYIMGIFNIYPYGQMLVFLYPVLITYGVFLKRY